MRRGAPAWQNRVPGRFAAKMAEFQHDHDGVEAATAPYADPEQSMQDQLLSMKDSMMHGRAPDVSSMEGLISNPIMQMAMQQVHGLL